MLLLVTIEKEGFHRKLSSINILQNIPQYFIDGVEA
jgi:hypothetical protein